ncbi:EcsC protein family protein [Oxobacter pfennigii]|uniref:EcsC protein family protein n=1 Tax=Oxobacter pfennigii TaxID=36849 RepID=A0A0N8NTQ3_9CLOT|nr:EcsC family protein [Oxobacter pfennigii]KPU45472.1 EcsC protein family protein [Oxobacter pfennigii]
MISYEDKSIQELKEWHREILRRPSITSRISKNFQNTVNTIIPDKFHQVITEAIKNMVKAVLTGSEFITGYPLVAAPLEERERKVRERINFYKGTAAVEGASTGAGGFLLSLADFPLLLSIEMKFLFDTASLYGFDVRNYKERLYILYIFQLAFSSPVKIAENYKQLKDWKKIYDELPMDINSFDWRTFQQEYRDYIDLAKMLQMLPGIGAVAGAYANYKLLDKLGKTAMNAYRLRILDINI